MSEKLRLSVSPHIHSGRSTAGLMRDVIIALLPAFIVGAAFNGPRAIMVVLV